MKINVDDFYTVYGVKTGLVKKMGDFDYTAYKNVQVEFLTYPIVELIRDNQSIIQNAFDKLMDCKGIILHGENEQFLYEIKDKRLRASFEIEDCQQFVFNIDYSQFSIDGNGKMTLGNCEIEQRHYEIKEKDLEPTVAVITVLITGFEMMKQYGVFDFQVIAVNKSLGYKSKKVVHDETFETDFKFPVRIVDCKYVRTLIREGEFKVRGFFRMQPYGSRTNPTYKLIWIDEHVREKHNILRQDL